MTAALARAEAAEHRAAELQALLDKQTVRPARDYPIPPRFRWRRSFGQSEVTWRRPFAWKKFLFVLVLAGCIPLAAAQHRVDGVLFSSIAILYYLPSLIASLVNRSTLRVTPHELVLRSGPIFSRRVVVPGSAITQAYCRGEDGVWSVEVAHGGTYVEIARGIEHFEALFLESVIEKELAIVDRVHERETSLKEIT